jgi:hypothetical protein
MFGEILDLKPIESAYTTELTRGMPIQLFI